MAYQLDDNLNRRQTIEIPAPAAAPDVTTYSPGSEDRYLQVGAVSIRYDASGNLIRMGNRGFRFNTPTTG